MLHQDRRCGRRRHHGARAGRRRRNGGRKTRGSFYVDDACERAYQFASVLRQHPMFRDLAPEALDQLCRYAKHTALKRGATIFAKDDPGNRLYAVISGTVKISITSPNGRNTILNLIGPGELFGEMAVLDGEPRSADATANTNC